MFVRECSNIGKILRLLRGINIHPLYLLVPMSLALASAAFEGVSIALLIPLGHGYFNHNVAFLHETPVLKDVITLLPERILADDSLLFGALLGGFILMYLLKNILKYSSILSIRYFAERALHHLRKTLFNRYLHFGKLFFDTSNVGHHNAILMEFTRIAMQPLLHLDRCVNSVLSLVVYLIVMLSISWELTLFTLPLFAVLYVSVRKLISAIQGHSRAIAERGSLLSKQAIEILSSIPLVKASRTEQDELEHFRDVSDEKAKLDFRSRALNTAILPLQEVITLFVAICIFVGAIILIGREQVGSDAAFLAFFYVIYSASHKFGGLMGFRGMLAQSTGPLEEIEQIFSDDGKHFVLGGDTEFPGLRKSISVRDLNFSYGEGREVLEHVNFEIEKGQTVAIVGPTGSGKSTVINLLMRYYESPANTVFVDDTDIREFSLDSYLGDVALVSQETLLLHDTLSSNITYGLDDVSEEALQTAIERARLADFIKELPKGLGTLIGDRGVKLSGGEKQRVSIARALLKGSEILILDEATSSLDSHTEKLIQEAIDEAIKDCTAIVIAHRLSTIQNADRILVLEHGKIVEEGKLDDLLERKGVFFRLWEEQKF